MGWAATVQCAHGAPTEQGPTVIATNLLLDPKSQKSDVEASSGRTRQIRSQEPKTWGSSVMVCTAHTPRNHRNDPNKHYTKDSNIHNTAKCCLLDWVTRPNAIVPLVLEEGGGPGAGGGPPPFVHTPF